MLDVKELDKKYNEMVDNFPVKIKERIYKCLNEYGLTLDDVILTTSTGSVIVPYLLAYVKETKDLIAMPVSLEELINVK